MEVLEEAGLTIHQRGSGEIVATTGSGLAPDRYREIVSCGRGESDVAAGVLLEAPVVDRPTGRFEIRVTPSDDGARLTVATDFTAQACRHRGEAGIRRCEPVACESTSVLEQRIIARASRKNE
ncbi:MAG TPA: hypothetical protein VM737_10620 [Gemmatimonadota bacterium]|nr:hypothetical protein [Gemmatimonadota bacterium]